MPVAGVSFLAGRCGVSGVQRSGGGEAVTGPVAGVPGLLGREQAVSRLLVLDGRGELTTEHVRLVAGSVGVSLRSVWRWLEVARREGRTGPRGRERFTLTPELHARLLAWCGNAAAVHRELVAEHAAAVAEGGCASPVPSLATLPRAIRRDLSAGQRAALAGGERARRRHDVHLRRPRLWRNACWEADHTHVPVEVVLDGELVCPWVTWFVDCATNAIAGVAVTPHQASRDAILAALRIALSRDEDVTGPYGPVGRPTQDADACAAARRFVGRCAAPPVDGTHALSARRTGRDPE